MDILIEILYIIGALGCGVLAAVFYMGCIVFVFVL